MSTQVLFTVTLVYSFTTVSVVPGIDVSSCLALLFTTFIVSVSNGFILTLNVNFLVSPAFKCTSIPLFSCASVYGVFTPSNLMLFSTSVVPVGTVSDITTEPSPLPLFVTVSVYSITSNSCSVAPLSNFCPFLIPTLDFVVVILATFVSVSGVSVSPTTAIFVTLVFVS